MSEDKTEWDLELEAAYEKGRLEGATAALQMVANRVKQIEPTVNGLRAYSGYLQDLSPELSSQLALAATNVETVQLSSMEDISRLMAVVQVKDAIKH